MHPQSFEYVVPKNLDEALSFLSSHEDAKVLSGGHSLIPIMKLRLASPKYVVDIGRLHGLSEIASSEDLIRIGALTRYHELENSAVLQEKVPMIPEATRQIGDPQVRNMGTIGGNLSHGDPANDLPPVMLSLDAEFVLTSTRGTRAVRSGEFYKDTFVTELAPDEVLTEIRVPVPSPGSGGRFEKFEQKAGDFAIVSVAASLNLDERNFCTRAAIGLGSSGPVPFRARGAENILLGSEVTPKRIEDAARLASEEARPFPDVRGSEEYKRAMIRVFAKRALEQAAERAREKVHLESSK